jgi:hypothetical protein
MTAMDMSGGHAVARLTVAQAEALTDAVLGELADDWPDDWPDHGQAFSVALQAVDDALNGETGLPDCCVHCIEHRSTLGPPPRSQPSRRPC